MKSIEEKPELNSTESELNDDSVELDLSGLSPELQRRIDQIAAQECSSRQQVLRQIIKRAMGIKKPDPV